MVVFQHPSGCIWPYIFISRWRNINNHTFFADWKYDFRIVVQYDSTYLTCFSWFWYTLVVVMLNPDKTSKGFSHHHHTCNCSFTNTISNKINFQTKFQTSSDKCSSVIATIPRATYRFYPASILSFNIPQNLQTTEHHSPIPDHQEMAHNNMKRNMKSDVF